MLNGVAYNDFDNTFNSFKDMGEAKKMQSNTNKLRKAGFGSVPLLLINNKYIPNTKNLKSMGEYRSLIKYLISKRT